MKNNSVKFEFVNELETDYDTDHLIKRRISSLENQISEIQKQICSQSCNIKIELNSSQNNQSDSSQESVTIEIEDHDVQEFVNDFNTENIKTIEKDNDNGIKFMPKLESKSHDFTEIGDSVCFDDENSEIMLNFEAKLLIFKISRENTKPPVKKEKEYEPFFDPTDKNLDVITKNTEHS